MTIRRKVFGPKLSDYLFFERRYSSVKNNILYNSQIFNYLTFQIALFIVCGVVGFFSPLFWAVGSSLVLVNIFLYLKARRLAHGLTITRKMEKFAREKSIIKIEYTMTNETSFPLKDLSFSEKFDGVQSGLLDVFISKTIPPQSQVKWVQEIQLDSGMGLKKLSPLFLSVEDELGMYVFKIQFFDEREIEVYPLIIETPKLKTSVSTESIDYGLYDLAKRGESNLFIGTREYRHGDPVKHINWKLSQKMKKIILNEYEKNTNSYVTIIIDFEKENQLGLGEISTWEASKDLALSLAINEIKIHNYIQVIANNLYLPFGNTKSQISLMEKHFTFYELAKSDTSDYLDHLQDLPQKGQIYYLCPFFFTLTSSEILETIKNLKMLGQNVTVISLNPFRELLRSVNSDSKLALLTAERENAKVFTALEIELKLIGIEYFSLEVSSRRSFYEQILKNTPHLIEDT